VNRLNVKSIAIIGGGPAGLMAAEVLSGAGRSANDSPDIRVDLFDAMPSLGRKFLMAGKGGLNITHSEEETAFRARYGARQDRISALLDAFGPDAVRAWMHGLGIASLVGSSGRVFPADMKAAPLLRAWLHRLRAAGVRFHVRHRWCAIERQANGKWSLRFATPDGERQVEADAVVLALGGGSWAKLGSDGRWVELLEQAGVAIAPLRPSNCGFDVGWSAYLRERFAGQPVKPVAVSFTDAKGITHRQQGEFVIAGYGVEGSLIYALSAPLRDAIEQNGSATLSLDLLPAHDLPRVIAEVARPRGSRSLSTHLHSRLGLKGVKAALLHEYLPRTDFSDARKLAEAIKALPLRLVAPRPLDEAISSAGGVLFEALDEALMVEQLPGVFCAGEMLDWEAPTGGYLLTACLSSGHAAGLGAIAWLQSVEHHS
jgi:hypothetical protein